MPTSQPPSDTRGILSPARMMQRVEFARYPPPEPLAGLVDWFWSVRWDLPMGFTHRQDVVSQPGVNVSVGNPPPPGTDPPPGPYPVRCVVNGVSTGMSTRMLRARGWNLAAKTVTGGFGAWVDDVRLLTDRAAPLADVLPLVGVGMDGKTLAREVSRVDLVEGAAVLGIVLIRLLADRPAYRIAAAREVVRVAQVAERDRSIRRVEQLAAIAGVTPRTLQRRFASCAGVSPTWVIRRFRLLDAAERVSGGAHVDWAEVAAELGYADQPHLTREFTATIGVAPAAYARRQRPTSNRTE